MNRDKLPLQLEIISRVLNSDEVIDCLKDIDGKNIDIPKINSKVVKIMAIIMKTSRKDADELVSLNSGKSMKEVQALSDKEYATILRNAVATDVLGFFA